MSGKEQRAKSAAKWRIRMQRSPELLEMDTDDKDIRKQFELFRAIIEVLALLAAVGAVQWTLSDDHCLGIDEMTILNIMLYETVIEEHLVDNLPKYRKTRKKTDEQNQEDIDEKDKKSKRANTNPTTLFGRTLEKLGFRPMGQSNPDCTFKTTGWQQSGTKNVHKLYCPTIDDSDEKTQTEIKCETEQTHGKSQVLPRYGRALLRCRRCGALRTPARHPKNPNAYLRRALTGQQTACPPG